MSADNNKNYYLYYGISFGLISGALVAVLLGLFLDTLIYVWYILGRNRTINGHGSKFSAKINNSHSEL